MSHQKWVCTWLSTSQPTSAPFFPMPLEIKHIDAGQTLTQTFRIGVGGQKLRLLMSNRYGTQPLLLGRTVLSITTEDQQQCVAVTFQGQENVVIAAHDTVYSDELALSLPSLSTLTLAVYLPNGMSIETFHWDARHLSTLMPSQQQISSRILLESVDVQAPSPDSTMTAIAVIGDSMVDGNGVAMDRHERWTDFLAEKMASFNVAVINAGQSGSRLLKDGIGLSTLSRFERDVLNQPGVSTCIVQVGLNDLGLARTVLDLTGEIPSADCLIHGYRQLLHMAKLRNIRMIGVTIVPMRSQLEYELEHFYSPEKEAIRQTINHWMRNSGEFDALIDSDLWVRDSKQPQQLNIAYDSGDHLHLNHNGHRLVAESIDYNILIGQCQD